LFAADIKQAFSRFTTIRYLTANFNDESAWTDRKLPAAMHAAWGDRYAVWEYEVMLANETGKDLYITIPVKPAIRATTSKISISVTPRARNFARARRRAELREIVGRARADSVSSPSQRAASERGCRPASRASCQGRSTERRSRRRSR